MRSNVGRKKKRTSWSISPILTMILPKQVGDPKYLEPNLTAGGSFEKLVGKSLCNLIAGRVCLERIKMEKMEFRTWLWVKTLGP